MSNKQSHPISWIGLNVLSGQTKFAGLPNGSAEAELRSVELVSWSQVWQQLYIYTIIQIYNHSTNWGVIDWSFYSVLFF